MRGPPKGTEIDPLRGLLTEAWAWIADFRAAAIAGHARKDGDGLPILESLADEPEALALVQSADNLLTRIAGTLGEPMGGDFYTEKHVVATLRPAPAAEDAYAPLRAILDEAFAQIAEGKGAERHAQGLPLGAQPTPSIARWVGPGYPLGQGIKKLQEAARKPPGPARAEILGAIASAAFAVLALDEAALREAEKAEDER